MRIYKYRAWDKDLKILLSVTCIDFESDTVSMKGLDNASDGYVTKSENLQIGAFTDFKDKNGIDIHEWDVCRLKGWGGKFIIQLQSMSSSG